MNEDKTKVKKMNVEEIRLQTFSNWPEDAPVEAHRVARSGFFATGNGLEVQCHWCGLKIDEWDYGDQVRIATFFLPKIVNIRLVCSIKT